MSEPMNWEDLPDLPDLPAQPPPASGFNWEDLPDLEPAAVPGLVAAPVQPPAYDLSEPAPEPQRANLVQLTPEDEENQRLHNAFVLALSSNSTPDAKVLRISRELGVPSSLVKASLPDWERTALVGLNNPSEWRTTNPALYEVARQRPELAKTLVATQKEIGPLTKAWHYLSGVGDILSAGLEGIGTDIGAEGDFQQTVAKTEAGPVAPRVTEVADAQSQLHQKWANESLQYRLLIPVERAKEAKAQMDFAKLNAQWVLGTLRGADTVGLETQINDMRPTLTPRAYGETGLIQDLSNAATGLTSTATVLAEGLKGGGAGAAIGALGGAVVGGAVTKTPAGAAQGAARGLAAGLRIGGQAGAFTGAVELEMGGAAEELRGLTTDQGKKLTPTEVASAAMVVGLINGGLEVAELNAMLSNLGPAAKAGALGEKRGFIELLKRDGAFRQRLVQAVKTYVKATAAETGEEMAQNVVGQVGKYVAASKADAALQAGPVVDIAQAVHDGDMALAGVALGGAATASVGFAAGLAANDAHRRAESRAKTLHAMAQTEAAQAAPDEFAAMVAKTTAAGGAPVTHVYIDGKAAQRLFQGENRDPKAGEVAANEALGEGGADKVTEAAATGGKVEVPVADYLAKFGKTEAAKALLDDTTTHPAYMTANERKAAGGDEAIQAAAQERANAALNEANAANVEKSAIDEEGARLAAELEAAGRSTREAKRASEILKAFLRTQFGENALPEDLAKYRLEFSKPGPDAFLESRHAALHAAPEGFAQRVKDFFVDSTTGVLHARAWKRARESAKSVAIISIEGVKYANDTQGGHRAGDAVYSAAANVLAKAGLGAVFKAGGDFRVADVSQAELDAALATANADPSMQGYQFHGLVGEVKGDVNATEEEIGNALSNQKDALEKAGQKAERGKKPLKATGKKVEGRPVVGTAVAQGLQDQLSKTDAKASFQEAFFDEATGLLNKDGRDIFLAAHPKKFWVSIDLNLLKAFNKVIGKANGDKMLSAFGELMHSIDPQRKFVGTHVSGDEFSLHGDSIEELKSAVARLTALAESQTVDVDYEDEGAPQSIHGLSFGFGIARDFDSAEARLTKHKDQLTRENKRGNTDAANQAIARGKLKPRAQNGDVGRLPGSSSSGPSVERGGDGAGGAAGGALGDLVAQGESAQGAGSASGQGESATGGENAGGARGGPSGSDGGVGGQALDTSFDPAQLEGGRPPSQSLHDLQDMLKAREFAASLSGDKKTWVAAFLDFVQGWDKGAQRPAMMEDTSTQFALERTLAARHGIVDPEVGYQFDAETGRTLAVAKGGSTTNVTNSKHARAVQYDKWLEMQRRFGRLNQNDAENPNASAPRGWTDLEGTPLARVYRVFFNPNADASTVIHESAHAFFDTLSGLAAAENATERQKALWADIQDWLGPIEGKPSVEQQEKFARHFEAYLREGKAPSSKLERAFTAFALWLRNIYRSVLSLGEDIEMNDQVRSVFDRMLATDDEIQAYQRRRNQPRTAAEAGMSEQDWLDEQEEMAFESRRAMLHAMRDRLRETEAWWQEELAKVTEAVQAQWPTLPAVRALEGLRHLPLDRGQVEAVLGDSRPRGVGVSETGADIDEAAALFGFTSGADMLRAVADLPTEAAWVKKTAAETMEERHPSVLTDRAELRKLVDDGMVRYTERRILAQLNELKRRGADGSPAAVLKAAAKILASKRLVGRLDAGRALAQERAAGRAKAEAIRRGNWAEARVQAELELQNEYLYRELRKAQEERDSFLKAAASAGSDASRARLGKAEPAYRDAVMYMLASLGLGDDGDMEAGRNSIDTATAKMALNGETVGGWVEPVGEALDNITNWRNLTLEQMRQVRDAIENIQAAARNKNAVLIEGKRVERETVLAAIRTEVEKHVKKQPTRGTATSAGFGERLRLSLDSAAAFLLGMQDLVRDMTGDDLQSMAWRAIVDPMRKAKHREAKLLRDVIEPITKALEKLPASVKATLTKPIDGKALFPNHTDAIQPPRERHELLAMALNAGNASNLQRLLDGRGITMGQLRAALNLLTADELKWVQQVFDANESLKKEAFDLEERDSGIRPEAIEAVPLELTNGTLRGGYFPAVYERGVSSVGNKQEGAALAALLDPGYTRPGTPHSHTKARADRVEAAISLDLRNVYAHLASVAHDIAFREAVKSVGGLLLSEDMRGLFVEHLGEAKHQAAVQWVKDVGQARAANLEPGIAKAVRRVRSNVAPAVLGWSFKTAVGDLANLPGSVFTTKLKARYLANGLAECARDGAEARAFALSKSGELRALADSTRQAFQTQLRSVLDSGVLAKGPVAWLKDHAFALQEGVSVLTATPVWMGAYRQGIAEGLTDADAVALADDTVTKAFPSHHAVETAGILRDKGFLGFGTMFYGYLNLALRAQYGIFRPLRDAAFDQMSAAEKAKTITQVAFTSLGAAMTTGVLAEFLMSRGPEAGDADPDDPDNELLKWANWFARKLLFTQLQLFPIIGEGAGLIEGQLLHKKVSPRASPIASIIDSTLKGGKTIANAEDAEAFSKGLDQALMALGLATGVPVAPFKTAKRLVEAATGVRPVDGAADLAEQLYTGRSQKQ